jgi:hypothetical protein
VRTDVDEDTADDTPHAEGGTASRLMARRRPSGLGVVNSKRCRSLGRSSGACVFIVQAGAQHVLGPSRNVAIVLAELVEEFREFNVPRIARVAGEVLIAKAVLQRLLREQKKVVQRISGPGRGVGHGAAVPVGR